MIRATRVTLLLLLVAGSAVPAYAKLSFWDWLAELSGPGPFHSHGNFTTTVYCWQRERNVADAAEGTTGDERGGNDKWFHLLQSRKAKGPCFSFDFRALADEDNSRFFPTRLEIYQGGLSYRLWAPLEVGVGAGVVHFHSSGGVTRNKAIFDVPRVTLRPLLLVPALQKKRNGGFGFIQVFYRASVIPGNLDQDDFAPKPGTVFQVDNDFIPSAGFLVDPIAALRLILDR